MTLRGLLGVLLLANAASGAQCPGAVESLTKPAELPRLYIDTTPPAQTGRILQVAADCSNLQKQINSARGGDTVQIPSGTSCIGNYILPNRPASSDWVVIRTSAPDSALPPGLRVTPQSAKQMPQILTPGSAPVFSTEPHAHHYRLIGLEIGLAPSAGSINYGLVTLGDASQASLENTPSNLVIDRCYLHGKANTSLSRAVAMNSKSSAVVDSYISEIHGVGFDTQAIGGWSGPGPYKIVNNYLEGAGENIMFGGAQATIPNLIPSDIEIRQNYLYKPLSWRVGDPTYAGTHWSVKNSFELKNAQRVLVSGNVFENNWADSQSGFAILFTIRTEGGTMPWTLIQDVTFENNFIKNVTSGVNILGRDDTVNKTGRSRRIVIRNNLFTGLAANGRALQILESPQDITIDHNTFAYTGGHALIMFDGDPADRFVLTNNILQLGDYGIFGSGQGSGKPALTYYAPKNQISNNVLVGSSAVAPSYPPCNQYLDTNSSVGFVSFSTANYRLNSNSRFQNYATDRKAVGADINAVMQAAKLAGVL